jgi:hypothetical protein
VTLKLFCDFKSQKTVVVFVFLFAMRQGYMKELRVWNATRSPLRIATNAYKALTGTETHLTVLYGLSGPLSANSVFLDDLTGRFPVRIVGGIWTRSPTAPPGPRELPPVYHDAFPEED